MSYTIYHWGNPVTITAFRQDCDEAQIKGGDWVKTHELRTDHPGGLTPAIRETALALLPNKWSRDLGDLAYVHNATSVSWLETAVHVMFFDKHRRDAFEAEVTKTSHRVEPHGGWDFIIYEA